MTKINIVNFFFIINKRTYHLVMAENQQIATEALQHYARKAVWKTVTKELPRFGMQAQIILKQRRTDG